MIIFINGSFGVGKTTIAKILVKRLSNSFLFDPEEVGFFLRNILEPVDRQDDFQHYPMWRSLTVEVARQLKQLYGRDLIIPMTIWRREYFEEVIGGLRKIDSNLHHFCLMAPVDVIHQRLTGRGEQKPGSWPYKQAELAAPSLKSDVFAKHLQTNDKIPTQIAEEIIASL